MAESELLPLGFPRDDLVRLLTQCIHSLGYVRAAKALEEESGIPLLAEPMAKFREGILDGQWGEVESLVDGLELRSEESRAEVRFLILRQKFLELIEAQRTDDALHCLRHQLAPLDLMRSSVVQRDRSNIEGARAMPRRSLSHSTSPTKQGQMALLSPPGAKAAAADSRSMGELMTMRSLPPLSPVAQATTLPIEEESPVLGSSARELSSYLMCKTTADLRRLINWDGAAGESRKLLLHQLQRHIPPSHLLPENRLQTLLQQAVSWQVNQCLCREAAAITTPSRSLLENMSLTHDQIPRETLHVLEKHSDEVTSPMPLESSLPHNVHEVWFVQFSHNGKLLASASKDNLVVIWDLTHPRMEHTVTLQGHTDSLSFVAWSPDDFHILTCGNDRLIKLWEIGTGVCLHTFASHTDAVTACAWMPDGQYFVSAGVDKNMFIWKRQGEVVQTWHGPRVNDLAVTHAGDLLIAICSERKILIFRIETGDAGLPHLNTSEESFIAESDSITSLSLSKDSRFLLVNVASEEIHAWDLQQKQLIHRYRGQKQGRFVIRSVFGGRNESFVASGSEDSQVYIWNRHNAMLMEVLPGHSGTVNAIAWNPMDPLMFASASDDHTVRIWGVAGTRSTSIH